MRRITARTAALTAAAALTLSACGGGGGSEEPAAVATTPSGPVTLSFTFWGNDDRAARYAEAITNTATSTPTSSTPTATRPVALPRSPRSPSAARLVIADRPRRAPRPAPGPAT